MYLTGLIHRDRLFEVATRWFTGKVEPGDGRLLTQIFIYESLISGPTSQHFLTDILGAVHKAPFHLQRIYLKDDLRETILTGCPAPTQRMEGLFQQYLELPEEFFPRTPVDLILAIGAEDLLLGMARIKRVRRVAEKASRRVADRLAGAIEVHARDLAETRAQAMRISLDQLVTPAETMTEEFSIAERIVSQAFRQGSISFKPRDLQIDDVIGFKFVGSQEELARIEEIIATHPAAIIAEREEHLGDYNAINLLVDLRLPPVEEIVGRMRGRDWAFADGRGLDPKVLASEFPQYVSTGARTLRAEVSLTTYEELVESEFGRSIHEERILDQRRSSPYTGRIANNATFIIEYLLMLAISPTLEVGSLPVKMWGRYLPDTFSKAVWKLFGIEHGGVLYDPFVLDPAEVVGVRDG